MMFRTPPAAQAIVIAAFLTSVASAQQVPRIDNPTAIDFSYAGFQGGGHALPHVPAVLAVSPSGGDDTALLQAAIDNLAKCPLDHKGFRGALLLLPGTFHVSGQLKIIVSGIVLRGSGIGAERSTIVAEGLGRRTLIQTGATADAALGPSVPLGPQRIPAGSFRLPLASTDGLHPGELVEVRRRSTAEWIYAHAMTGLPGNFADARLDWKPGSHDLVWQRTITAVDAATHSVNLDAPITFAIDSSLGPGTLSPISTGLPITNIGIENLTLLSSFDTTHPNDEEHSWIAISLDNVQDAWVRGVTARHFVSSAVFVGHHGRRITVENCRSEAPVSERGGYRRQSFLVYGQQVLFLRCYSEGGMNDFATGLLAAGPNVFLNCTSTGALEPSGPFEGLASGVLYENVHVPASRVQMVEDQTRAQAAGWTAVNSLIWNSEAQSLDALGPYDGYNYVRRSASPLYRAELQARGLDLPPEHNVPPEQRNLPLFHASPAPPPSDPPQAAFSIVNGRFIIDGKVAYGGTHNEAWWHGNTSPEVSGEQTGWSVSRFMPGQVAPGLTEDLPSLVARVQARGEIAYQTIPGLWYDHRRDEHSITRRQAPDVWAPFFEMPWARSGTGIAWDGLSRFDLSRYNPWYFARERDFARIAGQRGLVVIYNLYNTHNVLEIGPHWIDYPWRPANNINDTGLPEPPPFEQRRAVSMNSVKPLTTRVNVGNAFYSADYPALRKLHHDYMLHVLDQLGDRPNVIFTLAYQYAGPLAFQQFFLDTVAEWEKQHGRKVRVALITSKGITDAILADPVRSKLISMVDTRYWYYLADGTLWAPDAGQNRAFRDLINSRFGGIYTNTGPSTTPELVYRQVREYHDRYPQIALFPMENGAGPIPILMGGAASRSSLEAVPDKPDPALSTDAILDRFVREQLSADLQNMSPADGLTADPEHTWVLATPDQGAVLIYSRQSDAIQFLKPLTARNYTALWFNPVDVTSTPAEQIAIDGQTNLHKPTSGGWMLLLRRAATATKR